MKAIKTRTRLTYKLVPQDTITVFQASRMYYLMATNYDCVTHEQFEKDLSKKQWVGLLNDEDDMIQGFTTFVVNPDGTGTADYNIIFSGDTIISPAYWGSLELVKGGMYTGGQLVGADPTKKWYWLLISKGHRTYMYLPLFFNQYIPNPQNEHADTLFPILDASCQKLFGDYWNPHEGLIKFPESMGQLKPELAASTWQKKKKPHVAFFLKKNPGFYMGHELACLTEASPENMRGIAQRFFMEGMENPLSVIGV